MTLPFGASRTSPAPSGTARRLPTRGTTTVEYLVVLSLVFLGATVALVALGPDAVALYRTTRNWAVLPVPRERPQKKHGPRTFRATARRSGRTPERERRTRPLNSKPSLKKACSS